MGKIGRSFGLGGRFLASAVLVTGLIPWHAAPAAAPFAYTWEEAYFPSGDGTRLHADILRHPGVPKSAKQPVILTVSPYLNHSGEVAPEFGPFRSGPSDRFFDFLKLGKVLERGYTYVMVDLRGTGGSAGCTDWGGPGEQADVKAAVEWAGSQPWSSGRVGVIGKSYDGWTGLMAIANRPKHLAAVVSMEPVFDGYRYLYTNGVRFSNSLATPAIFIADDATPGTLRDTPEYHLNGTAPNAACYALYYTGQQNDEAESRFWQDRELIRKSRGTTTPLLLTQGFLETNTMPDGAFAYFNGMAGPKRAWFGQFDHVRGWEKDNEGKPLVGREGFITETMRFIDRYVKGLPSPQAPIDSDPTVAVQGIDGRYRSEAAWPPADAMTFTTGLRPGSYFDSGNNYGDGSTGNPRLRLWSISQPLPYTVHLAGEPVLEATVDTTVLRANLVANVYDLDPNGRALMISRGAMLLRKSGTATVSLPMYGQDWPIPAGHRIGVAISGSNSEWWTHLPTRTDVVVESATIKLPFLRLARTRSIAGAAGPRLEGFHESEAFWVAGDTIGEASTTFSLPAPMKASEAVVKPSKSRPKPVPPAGSLPATGVGMAPLTTSGTVLVTLSLAGWTVTRRRRYRV